MHTFSRAALLSFFLPAFCLSSTAYGQSTIQVPADVPTIQQAIDSSSNGDSIVVAPGTYFENIDFHGHNVSLTASGGPDVTILDGGRRVSTVKFVTNETRAASISGFTIQNGQPTSLQIGCGIYIFGASPTIRGNVLVDNYCSGIASRQGGPLLQKNTISATHAYTTCTYPGTAITLYGSATNGATALVDGNTLFANVEETYGALMINTSEDNVVQNNIIRDNAASGSAACSGGACILNTFAATFVGNEF